MNKIILIGRMAAVKMRTTENGTVLAKFTVVTSEKVKGVDTPEFHNCISFGKVAENIYKFFPKGKPIAVDGKIQTRSWEDEGQKKYMTEIIVNNFEFLPETKVGNEVRTAQKRETQEDFGYPEEEINAEDIPF